MVVEDNYTLLSTAVRIANSADLPYSSRLKSLAQFIKKAFRLHSATIYFLDSERRTLSLKIRTHGTGRFQPRYIPMGEGAAGLCALRQNIVITEPGAMPGDEAVKGGAGGVAFLPLIRDKIVVGVLSLVMMKGSPITEPQIGVLRDISTELAGLICSLEIAERSDRRNQHLLTLNELAMALHQPVPFSSLLPFILRISHKNTGSSCTILRIFGHDVFSSTLLKECAKKHRPHMKSLMEIENECSARMLDTGTPLLITDVIASEDLPPSYICVPIHYESQIFGTLTFFGKTSKGNERNNFEEEDRELFEGMANLIANTLAGVRFYRRMTTLADDNLKKLKNLSLLYNISNAMHSTTRINKLIHLSLNALILGSPPLFERAMLFLVNKHSGTLQGMCGLSTDPSGTVPHSNEDGEDFLSNRWQISDEEIALQQYSALNQLVKGTRIRLDKSGDVLSRAVMEKKPILADSSAGKKASLRELCATFNLTSFAVVPLIAKKETIALVIVDNPVTGRAITPGDQRILHLCANQAGMAIENSILCSHIENANREHIKIRQRLLEGERLASLGETTASVAHELKGPLVSIGGLAKRLLRMKKFDSQEWQYADTIAREAGRLEKMIVDILFFTKRATICYSDCSLNSVLEGALSVVYGYLEDNGIRVKRRYSCENAEILGDSQQLRQVFINIFSNAGEAMSSGGVLTVSMSSTLMKGNKVYTIKIRDTGAGIPEDILPTIFNPFFTTKDGGTGLGLPIVHRIVTNHSGRVLVKSKAGAGSEFKVILPVHPQKSPFHQPGNPV